MNIKTYYKKRATHYEEAYQRDDSIRQHEQAVIKKTLLHWLNGKDVLEVACGTGYWTQFLSETAKSITAIDAVEEVLNIARSKEYQCPVAFLKKDAYKLSFKKSSFNGGLANFWFSHIPKKNIELFLEEFHMFLQKKSRVFIADDIFSTTVGGKFVIKPNDENTYKLRTLRDGTQTLVLKNYFAKEELVNIFNRYDNKLNQENIFYGNCFWYIMYELNV